MKEGHEILDPDLEIVIAREPKQSGFTDEIAAHLTGARND